MTSSIFKSKAKKENQLKEIRNKIESLNEKVSQDGKKINSDKFSTEKQLIKGKVNTQERLTILCNKPLGLKKK